MLVTNSLPPSLLFSKLDWYDPGVWRCPLQTYWGFYCCWCWIVLATVCCRFGSWGLVIKLNFCSDFQHKVWSGVWRQSSGEILKLKFGQYFAADVWLRLQSWILVKILNLGLVLNRDSKIDVWSRFVWNLWYELNPRVRCAFGNVFFLSMHLPGLSALGLLWLLDHADWNKRKHNSTVPTVWGVTPTWGPKPCWIGIRKRRRRTPCCMKRVCSDNKGW